jgi:hypothetical protein
LARWAKVAAEDIRRTGDVPESEPWQTTTYVCDAAPGGVNLTLRFWRRSGS